MNHTRILPSSHRDAAALERRRQKAAKLFAQGQTQAEIARKFCVSREAVRHWHDTWKQQGLPGLTSRGKPGPKPRLDARSLQQIEQALLKGPTAYGFSTQLWTLGRIATVIRKTFGVTYGTTRVWQLLLSLNWSCQKPETRAGERDEAAIRAWTKTTWPKIKKTQSERVPS
jgi:transposase